MSVGSVTALVVRLAGDRVIALSVSAVLPVLVIVTVCPALVVPTD